MWIRVAAWCIAVTEMLAFGTVVTYGVDRIGGIATHAALLVLSLAVAIGVSRRTIDTQGLVCSQASTPVNTEEGTDPLDNRPWISLVEECVQLLDEMDREFEHANAASKEVAAHAVSRLGEILERAGVEVIDREAIFDRLRHQALKATRGMTVIETVSPGYAVGRRVLRRAKVIVRPD